MLGLSSRLDDVREVDWLYLRLQAPRIQKP